MKFQVAYRALLCKIIVVAASRMVPNGLIFYTHNYRIFTGVYKTFTNKFLFLKGTGMIIQAVIPQLDIYDHITSKQKLS